MKTTIAATIALAILYSSAAANERYMHKCKYSKSSPTLVAKNSPRESDIAIEFRRYYEGARVRLTYVESGDKSYYLAKALFKNKLKRCTFTGLDGKVSKPEQ